MNWSWVDFTAGVLAGYFSTLVFRWRDDKRLAEAKDYAAMWRAMYDAAEGEARRWRNWNRSTKEAKLEGVDAVRREIERNW
jgi:hypothetical protein